METSNYENLEKEIREVMQDEFGFSVFLPDQEKAVKAVIDGNLDVIVSMATNSGKSLCFQLPPQIQRDGIVLVVTPNLSLMECQKHYLNKLQMRAISIDSTDKSEVNRREIRRRLEDRDTIVKFFYITPEMASKDYYTKFLNELLRDGVFSHFVIDEAHCLTDKKYRESFSILKEFREKHRKIPFIALTTASTGTLNEIQSLLGMKEPTIIQSSSVKTNIFYEVTCVDDALPVGELDFLKTIEKLAPDYKTLKQKELPSGIIYCRTVAEVNDVLAALETKNISATSFYGSMDSRQRFENYDSWISDKVPVMVATSESFGLGIVKPRVKFVIHTSAPRNVRAYYQESGRGGATGDKALSVVYYRECQLKHNSKSDISKLLTSKECYRKQLAKFFEETTEDCGDRCSNCVTENEPCRSPFKKLKL